MEQFKVEMNNRYEALHLLKQQEADTGLTIDDLWDNMKKVWKEPAELVLGQKRHNSKPWISQKTLEKLEERRKAKASINQAQARQQKRQAQQTHSDIHKQVRACVRTDKRTHADELAVQGEEAAAKGNIKELYSIVRKIYGNFRQCNKPIRDRNGTLLTTHDAQMIR